MKIIKKFKEFINEMFNFSNYELESITANKITYKFILNDIVYKVYFNNINENNLEHYHLSFCMMDINNNEEYSLLYNTKKSLKVFSNVKNITENFIKERNIDLLIFDSLEKEREFLYLEFTKSLVKYFDKYNLKNIDNKRIYILSKKHINYNIYFNNNLLTKFLKK